MKFNNKVSKRIEPSPLCKKCLPHITSPLGHGNHRTKTKQIKGWGAYIHQNKEEKKQPKKQQTSSSNNKQPKKNTSVDETKKRKKKRNRAIIASETGSKRCQICFLIPEEDEENDLLYCSKCNFMYHRKCLAAPPEKKKKQKKEKQGDDETIVGNSQLDEEEEEIWVCSNCAQSPIPPTQTAPSTTQTAPSTTQTAPSTTQTAPSTTQTAPPLTQTASSTTNQTAPSTTQTAPPLTQTASSTTQTAPTAQTQFKCGWCELTFKSKARHAFHVQQAVCRRHDYEEEILADAEDVRLQQHEERMWVLEINEDECGSGSRALRRPRRAKTNTKLLSNGNDSDDSDEDENENENHIKTTLAELRLWPGRLKNMLLEHCWPEVLRLLLLERCGLVRQKDQASSMAELIACKVLLNALMKRPNALMFLYPIDLSEYPDYTQIVQKPICLTDIQRKINTSISLMRTGESSVAVAATSQQQTVELKMCPNGHDLTTYPCTGDVSCDRCNSSITIGKSVRGCAWCNFDVCEECFSGRSAPSSKRTSSSSSSSSHRRIPYVDANDFRSDVMRVWSNCHIYNHMDSPPSKSATELQAWFEKAFDGLVRVCRPCRSLDDETLKEIQWRCERTGFDAEVAKLAESSAENWFSYKTEREMKKLRAKHAACVILIREDGQTMRDLAKSCCISVSTLCAVNHYRRHLVQLRIPDATSAPVLTPDTVLCKGAEVLLPPYWIPKRSDFQKELDNIISSSTRGYQGPVSKELLVCLFDVITVCFSLSLSLLQTYTRLSRFVRLTRHTHIHQVQLQNNIEAKDNETPRQIARRCEIDVNLLVALNKDRYEGLVADAHLIEGTVLQLPSVQSGDSTLMGNELQNASLEDFLSEIEDQDVTKRIREVASEPTRLANVLKTKDYVQWDMHTRLTLLKWLQGEVFKLPHFQERIQYVATQQASDPYSDWDSDDSEDSSIVLKTQLRAEHELGRDRDGNRYWCFASPADPVRPLDGFVPSLFLFIST